MNVQLSVADWLQLSFETRNQLSNIFSIPKSRGSVVESNTVISDGHTHEDLSTITVEKMQDFLQVKGEDDFVTLFHRTLDVLKQLAEAEDHGVEVYTPSNEELLMDGWRSNIERLKNEATTHGMLPHLTKLATIILDIKPTIQNDSPKKRTTKKSK